MRVTRPPAPPRAPRARPAAVVLVLLLCVIWGIQQVAIKFVAADVPPVMQLAIRFAGRRWSRVLGRRDRGSPCIRGRHAAQWTAPWLMFALEFVLAGSALLYTTAATPRVLVFAPIFTALGLQFLPEERLARAQWVGIAAAFAGIIMAFVGPGGRAVAELVYGDSLALLGGAAWG